jgi:hypothetical protein
VSVVVACRELWSFGVEPELPLKQQALPEGYLHTIQPRSAGRVSTSGDGAKAMGTLIQGDQLGDGRHVGETWEL